MKREYNLNTGATATLRFEGYLLWLDGLFIIYRKKFVDLGVRFLIGVTRVLVCESVESM